MKDRSGQWKLYSALMLVCLFFLSVLFHAHILTGFGRYLVKADNACKADAIVVLMGSIPDRILHAADLYHLGYADTIIMIRSRDFDNREIIDKLGLDIPGGVDINRDLALQLEIPAENIIILDGLAESTWDEAEIFSGYAENQEISSLILVTSKYHSRRAALTFTKVLDERNVISSPSAYDPFDYSKWWQERRSVKYVLLEYQKLLDFFLFRG